MNSLRTFQTFQIGTSQSLLRAAGALLFLIAVLTAIPATTYAHNGNSDPNAVHACVQKSSNQVRIVGVDGSCTNSETAVHWSIVGPQGPVGPTGATGATGSGGDLVLVVMDDFDSGGLDPAIWTETTSGTGSFSFFPGYLNINSGGGNGSATLTNNNGFSVLDGDLIFKARLYAYADGGPNGNNIYGNFQPRGLVAGTDRNNAIEFVSASGSSVACRTVANGVATQTIAPIPVVGPTDTPWIYNPHLYQIIAKPGQVRFFINGALVATHTTNIPTEPLNAYFSSSNTFGFVPIYLDFVSFERRQ